MYTGKCDYINCNSSISLVVQLTGVEADVASGLVEESSISTETAIQAREQVNNLMEKLVSCQCLSPFFKYCNG